MNTTLTTITFVGFLSILAVIAYVLISPPYSGLMKQYLDNEKIILAHLRASTYRGAHMSKFLAIPTNSAGVITAANQVSGLKDDITTAKEWGNFHLAEKPGVGKVAIFQLVGYVERQQSPTKYTPIPVSLEDNKIFEEGQVQAEPSRSAPIMPTTPAKAPARSWEDRD
jgi:hypothetical protein